jgi:hypothetical protein
LGGGLYSPSSEILVCVPTCAVEVWEERRWGAMGWEERAWDEMTWDEMGWDEMG